MIIIEFMQQVVTKFCIVTFISKERFWEKDPFKIKLKNFKSFLRKIFAKYIILRILLAYLRSHFNKIF